MNAEYSMAMSEVLCIINQSDDSYKSRIPQSFKKFIEENADATYLPKFDINMPIKNLNLRKETKGILALIYRSYICSEDERAEYDKLLKNNSNTIQKELTDKYNVYKIFDERKNSTKEQEFDNTPKNLVKYKKENIFMKIINKIKNIFRRR